LFEIPDYFKLIQHPCSQTMATKTQSAQLKAAIAAFQNAPHAGLPGLLAALAPVQQAQAAVAPPAGLPPAGAAAAAAAAGALPAGLPPAGALPAGAPGAGAPGAGAPPAGAGAGAPGTGTWNRICAKVGRRPLLKLLNDKFFITIIFLMVMGILSQMPDKPVIFVGLSIFCWSVAWWNNEKITEVVAFATDLILWFVSGKRRFCFILLTFILIPKLTSWPMSVPFLDELAQFGLDVIKLFKEFYYFSKEFLFVN
jgi:hypothetical protein